MVQQITERFWWTLAINLMVLALYILGIVLAQRKHHGASREVSVDNLRDPLVAALQFLAIAVALVAAASGYLASQKIDGSANFLVLAIGCFIMAGLIIVWFLLGLPNLAAAQTKVAFAFPADWDVILLPNIAKLLIILGLFQLGAYLLFELRFAPPAGAVVTGPARQVTVWTGDRPCVIETETKNGKIRIAVQPSGSPGRSDPAGTRAPNADILQGTGPQGTGPQETDPQGIAPQGFTP